MLKFIDNLETPAPPLTVTIRNKGYEDVTAEKLPLIVTDKAPAMYTIHHARLISPGVYEVYNTGNLKAFLTGYFTALNRTSRNLTLEINGGREVE